MSKALVMFSVILTSIFSDAAFAGKLRSERIRVLVANSPLRGNVVHVAGWSAIPATTDVAIAFDKLKSEAAYVCDVLFYEGATGWTSGLEGQMLSVQMVYKISGCTETTERDTN